MFPIFEFVRMRGPMAFIKVGDRSIEIRQINRILGKFFKTPIANFELDGEYEYRVGSQQAYIYNIHNGKPISLSALEHIQEAYRDGKFDEIVKYTEAIDKTILESKALDNGVKVMELLGKEKYIDLPTEVIKFLVDYRNRSKKDLKILNLEEFKKKRMNEHMSGKLGAFMPLVIFSMIGIFGTLFMQFILPAILKKAGVW